MNLTFIDAVRLMRDAQRRYFRNRDPQSLADAKRLEREVDATLAKINTPQGPQTGSLFSNEVDLEEEMTAYIERHFHIRYDETLEVGNDPLTTYDFEKIARHFAEWGAIHLNAGKEE